MDRALPMEATVLYCDTFTFPLPGIRYDSTLQSYRCQSFFVLAVLKRPSLQYRSRDSNARTIDAVSANILWLSQFSLRVPNILFEHSLYRIELGCSGAVVPQPSHETSRHKFQPHHPINQKRRPCPCNNRSLLDIPSPFVFWFLLVGDWHSGSPWQPDLLFGLPSYLVEILQPQNTSGREAPG